ncbi:MAG: tetratricopeptide repeat protein, partial [Gemmatimonadota bacterium]
EFEEFGDDGAEEFAGPSEAGPGEESTEAAPSADEEADPFDRAFDDAFELEEVDEEEAEEDYGPDGGMEELPLLDAGDPPGRSEEAVQEDPLPMLPGPEVTPALGGSDRSVDDLRRAVRSDPSDADAWRLLGVALFDEDRDEEAREALASAHEAYGEQDDPERAMRVMRELIFHEPEEIDHYKRLVEYAHRTGDRALLVPAFLEMAEALERTGAARKAEAVYGQVIALDPRNPRARRALAMDGEEGLRAGRQPRQRGDFVDLGGMVLDEPAEPSFRWTVSDADADPSGDEEADFARMLSRFKEKVATNLPSDDATAHYDLGAAYKDMGLMDEAVSQFQSALRAHPGHLAAYEMVGQCFLEKGEPEFAVRSLRRALEVDYGVEDELLGIYYYLGSAYEGIGDQKLAREFYERVFSLDINFKDVTDRLRSLR